MTSLYARIASKQTDVNKQVDFNLSNQIKTTKINQLPAITTK